MFLFFFKDFIYLFNRERERERERASERRNTSRGSGRGRSRLQVGREPNAGLNPRTLGSHPEPKADA